jgi:putative lipoprotein
MYRCAAVVVMLVASFGACVVAQEAGMSTQGAASAQSVLTGSVTYMQRIALPPNAAIEVKLQDVSSQDAPATTIAETVFAPEGKQVPIPFTLPYNPKDINPAHTYQVRANISVNGKPMFVSSMGYDVLTKGAPSQIVIMTKPAPPASGKSPARKLQDSRWVLSEVDGNPAQSGEGHSAHFELHPRERLTGSTGCNNFVGSYIASQGALQLMPSATTMKMCEPQVAAQEQAFLGALKATTNYKIDETTLELLNGDKVLAKFQAEGK